MKKKSIFLLLVVVFAIMCGVQATGCAEGSADLLSTEALHQHEFEQGTIRTNFVYMSIDNF